MEWHQNWNRWGSSKGKKKGPRERPRHEEGQEQPGHPHLDLPGLREDDHRYHGQSPQPGLFQRDLPGLREGDFFGTIAPKILLVSMTWENSPLLPAVFD